MIKKNIHVGHVQIRIRGIDAASIVLWVDGGGQGTASECTHICEKEHWNLKCTPFVNGTEEEMTKIFDKKDYLSRFKNNPVYYADLDDLKAKLLTRGITAAKKWVNERMLQESDIDKNK